MREAIRALLFVVLIAVVGFFAFAWWTGDSLRLTPTHVLEAPTGTSGTVDAAKARERGAAIGERAAEATARVQEATARVHETVNEAALTAKIKAKMALDDSVKSRAIDVTTNGSTVTLSGRVGSMAEHDRAVDLARETAGVTKVTDELTIGRRD